MLTVGTLTVVLLLKQWHMCTQPFRSSWWAIVTQLLLQCKRRQHNNVKLVGQIQKLQTYSTPIQACIAGANSPLHLSLSSSVLSKCDSHTPTLLGARSPAVHTQIFPPDHQPQLNGRCPKTKARSCFASRPGKSHHLSHSGNFFRTQWHSGSEPGDFLSLI